LLDFELPPGPQGETGAAGQGLTELEKLAIGAASSTAGGVAGADKAAQLFTATVAVGGALNVAAVGAAATAVATESAAPDGKLYVAATNAAVTRANDLAASGVLTGPTGPQGIAGVKGDVGGTGGAAVYQTRYTGDVPLWGQDVPTVGLNRSNAYGNTVIAVTIPTAGYYLISVRGRLKGYAPLGTSFATPNIFWPYIGGTATQSAAANFSWIMLHGWAPYSTQVYCGRANNAWKPLDVNAIKISSSINTGFLTEDVGNLYGGGNNGTLLNLDGHGYFVAGTLSLVVDAAPGLAGAAAGVIRTVVGNGTYMTAIRVG
jgi:hypothetical protein